MRKLDESVHCEMNDEERLSALRSLLKEKDAQLHQAAGSFKLQAFSFRQKLI